jgi:hypothetical protein
MKNVYEYRGNEFIPHDCCAIAIVEKSDGERETFYLRSEREIAMINDVLLAAGHNPQIVRSRDWEHATEKEIRNSMFVRNISKDWSTHMSYDDAVAMLEN